MKLKLIKYAFCISIISGEITIFRTVIAKFYFSPIEKKSQFSGLPYFISSKIRNTFPDCSHFVWIEEFHTYRLIPKASSDRGVRLGKSMERFATTPDVIWVI